MKKITATTNPMLTTIQRNATGFTLPARLPPAIPPSRALTAMTAATPHSTQPETRKRTAAAVVVAKAMNCFSAFRRVSESSSSKASMASTITLRPAPK